LILGFAILSPLLIWNDIKYFSAEYYCSVPFLPLRGFIWMMGTAYGLPLLALLFIYFRVTTFIHHQSNNRTVIIQRRQERDMLAIRRIIITVNILLMVGIPSMILLIMAIITGVVHPLAYRIQWFIGGVSVVVLSITTVIFTPPLKRIVMNRWQRNRVESVTNNTRNVIPMRTIATVQSIG
jgi:hypothetical protein